MESKAILIECPRDAMQGLVDFIPTEKKAAYIGSLLEVGFSFLDSVSFVSSQAVPQMRDSEEVLSFLPKKELLRTKILGIVVNLRGAQRACAMSGVSCVGYPLSVSETFQWRNARKDIARSKEELFTIHDICSTYGKEMVVYLSMGFGNPYGDRYHISMVLREIEALLARGVEVFSLADTVGMAEAKEIGDVYGAVYKEFGKACSIGVHLHAPFSQARDRVSAAFQAGCMRFDATLGGYGGCPMASDALIGNIPMEVVVDFLDTQGIHTGINQEAFERSKRMAKTLFDTYT